MRAPIKRRYSKGDLVKQKELGGHVMTVIEILNGGAHIIGSYSTPDGKKHEETWPTAKLKLVDI